MTTEKQYRGVPIGVSKNLPYTPYQDEVLLVDGNHTIKVERWRIEYYMEEISNIANVPADYAESYSELIIQMMKLPSFWEYFSEDDRHDVESELIDAFDFPQYIEATWEIKPSLFILDETLDGCVGYRFRQFELGRKGFLDTLNDAFAFMDRKDHEAGVEYDSKSDEHDVLIKNLQLQIEQLQQALNTCRQQLAALGISSRELDKAINGNNKPMPLYIIGKNIYLSQIDLFCGKPLESIRPTEIRLAPLDKAVYFLYLNHPEGINFSYLSDYREELLEIYRRLMNYRTNASMIRSVEDVTDPTNNSINEKCARIRKAFVTALGALMAEPYCIMGPRGEVKKIALSRDLVKRKQ